MVTLADQLICIPYNKFLSSCKIPLVNELILLVSFMLTRILLFFAAVAVTTGLTTAAAVGITAVLSSIVSFSAGLLVASVIARCYCNNRRKKVQSDSASNGQQVAPVCEEVSTVAVKDIEMKENVAYRTVVL